MRYVGGAFAILIVVAVAAGAASRPLPASAAPCPTSTKASPAKTTGAPVSPNAKAAASTSASASPSTSAEANDKSDTSKDGGIIQGIVDFFDGLFGGKKADPEPSPSASASPSPSAGQGTSPASTTQPAPTKSSSATPCASASASAPAKRAALAAGQPAVAAQPSLLIASVQTMSRLSYDGIVDLPTKTSTGAAGTIRVLKFSMSTSESSPFELRTPGGPKDLETRTDPLKISGNVSFYTTRFHGWLIGVIPQTYTPEEPPPLIVPAVLFTKVDIDLVFVQANTLQAPTLDLRYAS
jgi:hypothetical protein